MTARFLLFLTCASAASLVSMSAGAQTSQPAASSQPASGTATPKTVGGRPGLSVNVDDPIGPPGAADVQALDVVNAMLNVLGGPHALDGTKSLRFTFEVSVNDSVRSSRTHWWDRRTNLYRIEAKDRNGKPTVTVFDADTRIGDAWIEGKKVVGEEARKQVESGYGRFINDSYWLLMPFKLFDPGVRIQMDGEALVHGSMCDRVRVTFEGVGLTPGDTYWAYIDRISHRMTRWGFILQGDREKESEPEETLYDWTGWEDFGGLVLATAKTKVDDPNRVAIRFRHIEASASFPEKTFTDPAPLAP